MGTNLPGVVDEPPELGGLGDGVAAAAVSVVAPYTIAPATPPTSMDPAIAAAAIVLRTPITVFKPPVLESPDVSVAT